MATISIFDAILIQMKELVIIWIGLSILGCGSAFWLYNERQKMKSYAGDIFVRKRCKEERKPLGVLTNKAGTRFEFVVEPDPERPGMVKYKQFTLRNPNLASSKVRGHLSNGIPYVDYVVSCDFPQSHQRIAALEQLLTHVRATRPELGFMDEIYVIEGVFKESKYAYDDCLQMIRDYVDMNVDIPDEFFYENMISPYAADVMGDAVNTECDMLEDAEGIEELENDTKQ